MSKPLQRKPQKSEESEEHRAFPKGRSKQLAITLGATLIVALVGLWFFLEQSQDFDASQEDAVGASVSIALPSVEAEYLALYVDRQSSRIDPTQERFQRSVTPGEHEIIVSAPGYLPWTKNINAEEDQTVALKPFMVPENAPQNAIRGEQNRTRYLELESRLQEENAETSATSSDGKITLDFSGSVVKARWNGTSSAPAFFCENLNDENATTSSSTMPANALDCPSEKTVFRGQPILDAAFVFGRNNVFAFGVPSGIYVTEITAREPQNLQPVYEGELGAVAITDGSAYFQSRQTQNVITEIPLSRGSANASESSATSSPIELQVGTTSVSR